MATNILQQREQQNVEKLHQAIIDEKYETALQLILNSKNREKLCSCERPPHGTSLHLSAKYGNLDIIKVILQNGVSVNIKQQEGHIVAGKTPLHEASSGGNLDVVKYLLSEGADINATDSDGQTPLFMACQGKNLMLIQHLIEKGADVNVKDHKKNTALLSSIIRAPTDLSVFLIRSGADVNACDQDGQSALHYAAEWGNCDLVKELLSKESNVNLQDKKGRTPLHITTDETTKEFLLKSGADINIRDQSGKPAIENQIDISKDEYQRINEALSKHTEMSSARPDIQVNSEHAAQIQGKFNKIAISGDEKVKEVKAGAMAELLLKTKKS